MAVYMKVVGKKQGEFKGDVIVPAFKDQIALRSVNFGMGNPMDAASLMPTGRTIVRPVTITKSMDKTSPLFMNAVSTREGATVTISYSNDGATNLSKKQIATVKLTNAGAMDLQHVAGADGNALESITFSFTKIEYTWLDGGIVSEVDVTSAA